MSAAARPIQFCIRRVWSEDRQDECRSKGETKTIPLLMSNLRSSHASPSLISTSSWILIRKRFTLRQDSTSILSENKDRYMLNLCSTDKWFIVELCEEARVKWISMATYEFFSSAFKDFTLSGSDVYPAKKWVEFQNFTAKNVRDMQWFKVDRPLVAR